MINNTTKSPKTLIDLTVTRSSQQRKSSNWVSCKEAKPVVETEQLALTTVQQNYNNKNI